MEEEHRSEGALRDTAPEPRYRGSNNMYRGVTISVKALTGAILAGLAALALAIVFLAGSGGFTVTFETDGGSQVPAQTCRYGELVRRPEDPVKEGYVFDGWYWDVEREHRPWDLRRIRWRTACTSTRAGSPCRKCGAAPNQSLKGPVRFSVQGRRVFRPYAFLRIAR